MNKKKILIPLLTLLLLFVLTVPTYADSGLTPSGDYVVEEEFLNEIAYKTINGNLYVAAGAIYQFNGELTVYGDVYVFGTMYNYGRITVTGTFNCLNYYRGGLSFGAGDYDYGNVYDYGGMSVSTLNVRDNFLSIQVPSISSQTPVATPIPTEPSIPIPTVTPRPTASPTLTPTPKPSESNMIVDIKFSEWLSTYSIQITATSTQSGTAYIKVAKTGSPIPSADQVIADNQKVSVSANTVFKINCTFTADEMTILGDDPVTVYLCVKDSKNGDTVVKSIDMNMNIRPAKLKRISSSWINHDSAKITCQSNKYGVYYWGWAEHGKSVLSFDKCEKGSTAVANKNFAFTVDNITSDNTIDVCIYIKGNDGTISTPLVVQLNQDSRPIKPHTHSKITTITKATTKNNGAVTTKCSGCGEVFSQEVIYYPKTINLSTISYTYNGKVRKPIVSIEDSNGHMISNENYTVSYSSGCKNAGTYNVKTVFKGNYTGSVTKTFTIKKANQAVNATNQSKTLGDKAFALNAKCTKGNGKLTYKSSNTKVATISNAGKITIKGVGKTTVTITAAANTNYNKAAKKVIITVNPKGTSLTGTIKNSASRKATVQWKRNNAVTGYQIRYSTNSSFKGAKTTTVKKNSTLKTTISKLTKGKTYYVQIRTYKAVSGKNYYSGWSASKKIKITK